MNAALRRDLDALVAEMAGSAAVEHVARDPIRFPRFYDDAADRELVGLIAALLAFGHVKAIGASVARVLTILGDAERAARFSPGKRALPRSGRLRPREWVASPSALMAHIVARSSRRRALARRLEPFVHRVYRGADIHVLLCNAAGIQSEAGSLGERMREHFEREGDLRESLACLADELRGPAPGRGLAHLIPDPRRGSACKRLLLYARWMVRPAGPVDLGLWPIPPHALVIPVDTHVQRIARNLGLTERCDASWRTAEEITGSLRALDADDPVKYDFAICHLGVSRACPSRREREICEACTLRRHCGVWKS